MAASSIEEPFTLQALHTASLAAVGLTVVMEETEKRENVDGEFIAYCVSVSAEPSNAAKFPAGDHSVWRRYNDFDLFRSYLVYIHGEIIIPPLPQKKLNFKLSKMSADKFDPEFVAKRLLLLQSFIRRVLGHPVLRAEPCVAAFLTTEDWKKLLVDASNQPWQPGLAETVKSLTTTMRAKAQDPRFADIKFLADALSESLGAIIAAHARFSPRLEEVFSSYSVQAKLLHALDFCDGPPAPWISDISDKLCQLPAACFDRVLLERDTFLAVMEEYFEYAESIRVMARRQQQLQLEVDDAQAAVLAKEQSLAELRNPSASKGFRGLFGSLMPSSESERAQREQTLERLIAELRLLAENKAREYDTFVEQALLEFERFKKQKSSDLRAAVRMLARAQKAQLAQALAVWRDVRLQLGELPLMT